MYEPHDENEFRGVLYVQNENKLSSLSFFCNFNYNIFLKMRLHENQLLPKNDPDVILQAFI